MKYRILSTEGNTVGLDSYLAYLEIGDDGYCTRYLMVRADGVPVRYTAELHTDEYGFLPEGNIDNDAEASKPEYGTFGPISAIVFESIWSATMCKNDLS
jgi:hypothetical protein